MPIDLAEIDATIAEVDRRGVQAAIVPRSWLVQMRDELKAMRRTPAAQRDLVQVKP